MRLIDADALKRYIDCGHLRSPTEKCFSELDVVQMLDKCPTIDAVPVVRCGDCKWYDEAFYACSKCGVCVNRDFFCADGARMDGEPNDSCR